MAAKKTEKKKELVVNGAEQGEKLKALEHALEELDKSFGKGAVIKLGSKTYDHTIPVVSTGCLTLDAALGVGGLPKGRIIEIFGPESSGKTTVALHVIAEAQKKGGIAAFVDAEHALDPVYAKNLGVNVDELYVSQPESGEQALEITETLIRTGALDVVVVDSVAALTPKAEIDGEMGDSFVGLQARLMSQALRKLTAVISRTQTCAIFINQLREKVGVMYGNPETTPGGRALKFYSSVRLDVRKADVLKDADKNLVGNHTKVKVVKNKVAPPFRVAEFDILYGKGISSESMILDMAVEKGMVEKNGAFYSYNGMRLGQGRDNARIFLETNPDVKNELDQKIRAILFAPDAEPMPGSVDAALNRKEEEVADDDDDLLLLDDSEPEEENS